MSRFLQLWNSEYPQQLAYTEVKELEGYLSKLGDLSHLLLIQQGQILGWYFNFLRNEKRWFVMLLDQKIQGKGWGTEVLKIAKENNIELNGWVIDSDNYLKQDGSSYSSPLGFYLKNGFELIPECRLENEKLSAVKIKWTKHDQ